MFDGCAGRQKLESKILRGRDYHWIRKLKQEINLLNNSLIRWFGEWRISLYWKFTGSRRHLLSIDMDTRYIRNFCIIAHIDHGKSTLADRFIELTHTVSQRELREQLLDDMDLERERGITIKAHPVRMTYESKNGRTYQLNLIDTPGHVDFSYEVSRSLSACEGALLVIDAAQGIQAQTIANMHLALDKNLEIIPVINKIDLPSANVPDVIHQIEDIIGLGEEEIILASAKTGEGVESILEAVVSRIPSPPSLDKTEMKALIFDSQFNTYRGAISYVRVFSGGLRKGMQIKMMSTSRTFEVQEVGIFHPHITPVDKLNQGEVGYIIANIKEAAEVRIGDTVTDAKKPASEPLPGYKEIQPMIFSGLYPVDGAEYDRLKDALEKLRLNDASFSYQPESSVALGFGFRCGFLGLLHLEVIFERIEREFDITTISTNPSVNFRVHTIKGQVFDIDNPIHLPPPQEIEQIEEPYIKAFIISPNKYISVILQLGMEKRGECIHTDSLDAARVMLTFELPLAEVVVDFYDKLKSITQGYASLDYELIGYRPSQMVKLDILINGEPVDAFSCIVHSTKAEYRGRRIITRLKDVIPKHLFSIPLQAAIGSRVIARETIRAMKKNVTSKCYGGDITRKRKLWEKQKAGKKRMKQVGQVQIPQKAFIEILKSG